MVQLATSQRRLYVDRKTRRESPKQERSKCAPWTWPAGWPVLLTVHEPAIFFLLAPSSRINRKRGHRMRKGKIINWVPSITRREKNRRSEKERSLNVNQVDRETFTILSWIMRSPRFPTWNINQRWDNSFYFLITSWPRRQAERTTDQWAR